MQLLLVAAMLAAPTARPNEAGGQWVEMEQTEVHTAFMDEASIDTGTPRSVWLRIDYQRESDETGDKRTFFLMELDCGARTMAMVRYLGYDARGNQTNEGEVAPDERQPGRVAPDTLGARVLERVCR